jgi:hypothetical protein
MVLLEEKDRKKWTFLRKQAQSFRQQTLSQSDQFVIDGLGRSAFSMVEAP